VFVAFLARSRDPLNLGAAHSLEEHEAVLEECHCIDDVVEKDAGPMLRALLDKKSVLYAGPDGRKDGQGPFQRVILLWNKVPDRDGALSEQIRKRGELVKTTVERMLPHLKGAVELVEYAQPTSEPKMKDLISKLEELVEEDRSDTRFVFLLGSGLAQASLAPLELADKKGWRGRFVFYLYGRTGGGKDSSMWDATTLFNLFEHEPVVPRSAVTDYPLALMDDACALDERWEGFLRKVYWDARQRNPVLISGGLERDRRWVAEAVRQELRRREGEWGSSLQEVRSNGDCQAMFRPPEASHSGARSDEKTLWQQSSVVYVPADSKLETTDLCDLADKTTAREGNEGARAGDERRPCLLVSARPEIEKELDSADRALQWSRVEIPTTSNPYLISTAWRRVVERKAWEALEGEPGGDAGSEVYKFQILWCAPCTLRFVREPEEHPFCLERALMEMFDPGRPPDRAEAAAGADQGNADEDLVVGQRRGQRRGTEETGGDVPAGLAFLESLFDMLLADSGVAPDRYFKKDGNVKAKRRSEWRSEVDQKLREIFGLWWKRALKEEEA
jgi:hypothetical protein